MPFLLRGPGRISCCKISSAGTQWATVGAGFSYNTKSSRINEGACQNGKTLYHDLPFWNIQYPCKEFKEALNRYLVSMEQLGYSELTIRDANSIIRLFLLHMESKGKHTLDCFFANDIENYLPVLRQKWSSGMSNPIYYLRGFFAFLYERQEIHQGLPLVLKVNAASKIKVKKGFEAGEIEAVLTAIDRSTPRGETQFCNDNP